MKIEIIDIFSLVIASLALLISALDWFRTERINQAEKARQIGEALLKGQILKNRLSDNIDEIEKILKDENLKSKHELIDEEINNFLKELNDEYNEIWDKIKILESVLIKIERGENVNLNVASIVATVSRLSQTIELTEFNIKYVGVFKENFYNNGNKSN